MHPRPLLQHFQIQSFIEREQQDSTTGASSLITGAHKLALRVSSCALTFVE
jgi:hypothetical protein